MATDLNLDVRGSIVGSWKGSDARSAAIRRITTTAGSKYTYGSTTTTTQSQIVADYSFTLGASSSISLDLTALAGADGKTWVFTSVKGFMFTFNDSSANNDLLIYGDWFVDTGAASPITSASEDAQFRIQPGGTIMVDAPGAPYLVTAGTLNNLTFDNQASSPTGGVEIIYTIWGMGTIA